jgi:class 3 adenylate cyclase/tetratricopeptide (TPR) repeat protein
MVTCTNCGTENPERAKFCLECGATLAPPSADGHGTRKLVTVLFADVVGSTALGERLDPETMRTLLGRYFRAARTVLERHGGTVEKFIGDAVMAVFGIPVVHEDDALRGVRAAVELREAINNINDELAAERGLRLEFRIGVNSGEVVVGSTDGASGSLVTGDSVNVAARLEQAAAPAEVLIGHATYRLVRDFVTAEPAPPLAAKGKSEPLLAYRLLGLATARERQGAGRVELPFVGRRREQARLREAFEDAGLERRCYLFTLLGSAGVGKSRLVAEFLAGIGTEATVVGGRCLPYGEGITYWPIGEVVRMAAGVEEGDDAAAARARIADLVAGEPDAERIANLVAGAVGLSTEAAPREEVFWALRRLLETLARERPLVCLIEDIHWAEPTLLDLLEHVSDWSRDAPILLLCTARTELLDMRPTWGGGKLNSTTILLEPLTSDLTRELVESLLGQRGLPRPILDRILQTAEGNPLFAEEIVRMLIDEGLLRSAGEGDKWTFDVSLEQVPIPTSVQAVIAARLDRLPVQERMVAERAAVAGRVFERDAVQALVPDGERDDVPAHLLALVRKEFVQPDRSELSADDAFRFRHLLIRDTAYEALSKQERSELHERFADWLEAVTGDRVNEYAEIVGYHLEQAQRYRRELGLDDQRTAELAQRAGVRLADAGRRAHHRGDPDGAIKLISRAISILPDSVGRREAMVSLIASAIMVGQWQVARRVSAQLLADAHAAHDEPATWKARLLDQAARMWSDPSFSYDATVRDIANAIPVFELANDHQGLAIAYQAEQDVHLGNAQWAKAMSAAERALEHAGAAGEPAMEDAFRGFLTNAALWGPTPVPAILEIAERNLAQTRSRMAMAAIIASRALARAMAGDSRGARADIAEAMRLRIEVLGEGRAHVFTAGGVEDALGDLAAAEAAYRATATALEAKGETGGRSTIVGDLALVLFERGRPDDEVVELVELCRTLASPDDAVAQAHHVRALVEARAGRHVEASRLIADATAIVEQTDFTWLRGVIAGDRGRLHEWAGDLDAARAEYEQALKLFEDKGDVMDAERVRQLMAGLERDRPAGDRSAPKPARSPSSNLDGRMAR